MRTPYAPYIISHCPFTVFSNKVKRLQRNKKSQRKAFNLMC